MKRDVLDSFLRLLKADFFTPGITVFSIINDLNRSSIMLESEILTNLTNIKSSNQAEYLDLVIKEVKQNKPYSLNDLALKNLKDNYGFNPKYLLEEREQSAQITQIITTKYLGYEEEELKMTKDVLSGLLSVILDYYSFEYGNRIIDFCLRKKNLNSQIQVDKLKKAKQKAEENQTINTKKMTTYFDLFCEIIDDHTILKKSTAIGVMIDLKKCIEEIKSETLKELPENIIKRNDYLDLKINEVEKRNYNKDADFSYIQKWLDEYKITVKDIIDMNFQKNPIEAVVDRHYNDMPAFSPEKDKAYQVQLDFYYFFCKMFSDYLILFFKSKKEIKENIETPTIEKPIIETPMKSFTETILIHFCKEISNERDIYESTFKQCYDGGIKAYTNRLQSEITENILKLPSEKINPYLDYVEDKIRKTPYFDIEPNIIKPWIEKYNLQHLTFPFLESTDVKELISMSIKSLGLTEDDRALMEDIQIDFYCYAAMIEAKNMVEYINSKRPFKDRDARVVKPESADSTNQLTVNQAVILLDRLGVFSSDVLENMSNVKKAKIISFLIGKNEKNIKTSIEKLELKPSELTKNYQTDLDKISLLLSKLE